MARRRTLPESQIIGIKWIFGLLGLNLDVGDEVEE